MDDAPSTAAAADRFLLAIVGGTIALVLVAVVVVFASTRQPAAPPVPDPDSPVGVVQAYVEAIRAGDADRAYALLSRAAQGGISLDEYRRRSVSPYRPPNMEQRILFEPVSIGPDAAEVRVTITRFAARYEPFSASTSHQDATVHLVREDGAWRVSQGIGPYPFAY